MANKLRTKNARVSFFAFLDMITAVTGVLVLITLLMALYLNDSPATPAAEAHDSARRQVAEARAKLEANLAELRRRQLEATALANRLFVIPEADRSGLAPVLVVLSATNGLCTRLGQTNSVEFARRPDNAEFRRMLETWNPGRERLVFYVRPSAVAHFRECEGMARSRSFITGSDAAEEDMQYTLATR